MPRSKAEVRWAYAHPRDPYARDVIAATKGRPGSVKRLPEHAKKKKAKRGRK